MVLCFLLEQRSESALSNLEGFAESCYRYTPKIAIRKDEGVFLEIGKSLHLFQGQSLSLRVQALARKFELQGRVVSAKSATAAWLHAVFGQSQNILDLPIESLMHFDQPFQSSKERDPHRDQSIESFVGYLKKLGLKKIRDFQRVSPQSLGSRFGRIATELHRGVASSTASSKEVWPVFSLREVISERQIFSSPDSMRGVEGIEPLLFMLRSMLDRLVCRVRSRSEKISIVEVELELEWAPDSAQKKRQFEISFSLPQSSSFGIMPILKNRLEHEIAKRPLSSEIVDMEIKVLESVPGPLAQAHLFDRDQEDAEKLDAFYVRVQDKIGKGSIFFAEIAENYLPEKAWFKADSSYLKKESSPDVWMGRPSRLLKKPIRLLRRGDLLFPWGKFAHRKNGFFWKIVDWNGPERIRGYWWNKLEARDYYRFVTNTGEHLWAFGENEYLFLHGYFD